MRRRVREQAHPVAEAVGADGDDREDELDDIAGVLANSEVRIGRMPVSIYRTDVRRLLTRIAATRSFDRPTGQTDGWRAVSGPR